jgi:opacity protein-like surface antigen
MGQKQTDSIDGIFRDDRFNVSSRAGFRSRPSWTCLINYTFRRSWAVTGLLSETRLGQSNVDKTYGPPDYAASAHVQFPFRYSVGTIAGLLSCTTGESLPFVELQVGAGPALFTKKGSTEESSFYRSSYLKSDSHFGMVAMAEIAAPVHSPVYGLLLFEYRRIGKVTFDMDPVLPRRIDGRPDLGPFDADFTHWQISAGVGVRFPFWRQQGSR